MNSRSGSTASSVALVTGASGFVGSRLAKHLVERNWKVHVLTRAETRLPSFLEPYDIQKHCHNGSTESLASTLAAVKPDVVFHLASLFISEHVLKDIEPLIRSNLLLGAQLLEAMDATGAKRMVNTGTLWQNYDGARFSPVNLYAATKQAFEILAQFYVEARQLSLITLRLTDTYGPADPRPKLLNLLRRAITEDTNLKMSPGEQLIDLVYVDDVVDAFVLAADRILSIDAKRNEVFFISSDQPIKLRELVARLEPLAGRGISVSWGARPYRAREVMVPWNQGPRLPGWQPKTSIDEGLRRCLMGGSP